MKTFAVIVLGLYFFYKFIVGIKLLYNWETVDKTTMKALNIKKFHYYAGLVEHFVLLTLTLVLYFSN